MAEQIAAALPPVVEEVVLTGSVSRGVADELSDIEALAGGIALRTGGLLETWQERLGVYPEALAAARIEEAALAWGAFHPTGFLTLARPAERLALVEYPYNDAVRVLRIVCALDRVWQPTSKRLADRVQVLAGG